MYLEGHSSILLLWVGLVWPEALYISFKLDQLSIEETLNVQKTGKRQRSLPDQRLFKRKRFGIRL